MRKIVRFIKGILDTLVAHSVHSHKTTLQNDKHIELAIQWLFRAQDKSCNNGVSEGYHLYQGWLPPYPETTGYIIETIFDYYHKTGNEEARERAIKMAEWLISMQQEDGAITDSSFKRKMVFDTGMIIFGLTRAYVETGSERYLTSAEKAGRWIMSVQDDDGAWRKYAVDGIPHTYYARVSWSLLKLHEITGEQRYIDCSRKNIEWVLKQQNNKGWFHHASFNLRNHKNPFTHTIAYTLRGVLESGIYLHEDRYTSAVKKSILWFLKGLPDNGRVHGTYDEEWRGESSFSCLTGNAQFAIILLRLFEMTKEYTYFFTAQKINEYLKKEHELYTKNQEIYGAIAGSSPIWGKYIHFAYPNWAVKFFIDALKLEEVSIEGKPLHNLMKNHQSDPDKCFLPDYAKVSNHH